MANDFPEVVFTNIPGAPKLQIPKLIMGDTKPVMAEGMGWAAPEFFDVDNDGRKDLLLGEFASRLEDRGIPNGNFVRVYKNEGTDAVPKFSDVYDYLYATDKETTRYPDLNFCLVLYGIYNSQLVDLDNDGYTDIVTGQYNPGIVTWFRGSDEGFLSGQKLRQFGDSMISNGQQN